MDWEQQETRRTGENRRRSQGTPPASGQRRRPAEEPGKRPAPDRRRPPSQSRPPQTRRPDSAAERKRQQQARQERQRQEQQRERREQQRKRQQQERRERQRREQQRTWQRAKSHRESRRTPAKPLPRRKLVLKLITTGAVALALILGMTIFFRVQEIRVTGNSRYTAQEIVEHSGVETGENLLTLGKSRAAGRILAGLPYVDQVQIGIKLPNTVTIDIVELEVAYAIQAQGGAWWLMDAHGKLLEAVDDAAAQSHIQVIGISAANPTPGGKLAVAEEAAPAGDETEETQIHGTAADRMAAALEILPILEEEERTGKVTKLDVSELYDIEVWYGEDYQVRFGGPTELTYKTRYMVRAVDRLIQDGYRGGVLDVTLQKPGEVVFTPW